MPHATVKKNSSGDWTVEPIKLDPVNDSVDFWDLDDVFTVLAPKEIVGVRLKFYDGPGSWNEDTGPLLSPPSFDQAGHRLGRASRNPKLLGTYRYDILVTCKGEQERSLHVIDPQIDNSTGPGTTPVGGDDPADDGRQVG